MSRRSLVGLWITLLLGLVLLASGCARRARVVVYASTAPPPPVVETITVAPGPNYVWVPGYHAWNGSGYVWTSGRWELRPAGRRAWVPGHWNHGGRGWYWVEGHWR